MLQVAAERPPMATHDKIATSWQSVADTLSIMNEFEGGVKPDQLKRHYAELMSFFRKEPKTSGYILLESGRGPANASRGRSTIS